MSIQSNLPGGPSEESKRIDEQLRAQYPSGYPKGIGQTAPKKIKEVPVPFRHVIENDWHRSFSFVERIQILFGCALNVAIRIPCRHNPGELGVLVQGEVTKFDKPTELLQHACKRALEQEFPDRMPILHEPAKTTVRN